MNRLTSEQYLQKDGGYCPNCKSGEIRADNIDVDGSTGFSHCHCTTCDAEWNDVWILSGYESLELPAWVIQSEDEPGLFWNNEGGWMGLDDATRFTKEESETLNLPIGGNPKWITESSVKN